MKLKRRSSFNCFASDYLILFRLIISYFIGWLTICINVSGSFFRHAFVQSEESAVSNSLLDAFEQGDQSLLDQVIRRPVVTYLDNEVAKLARELQVPGGLPQNAYIPPSELINSDNFRPEQKNDFFIYNQNQDNSHSLNDRVEKESNSLHDQVQKNDKQESDKEDNVPPYIIDEKVEVPTAGNQIHLSSTTIPVPSSHSNFNQNTVVEEEDGLC
jgi:hypothetical protein